MRTENSNSLALERSMNLQAKIMTFEEALRNATVIDELDDERRKNSFNLFKWQNDMFIHFKKRLENILIDNTYNLLETFLKDFVEFNNKFQTSLNKLKKDELHYESLDDELREFLINYSIKCREELKIENSAIEKKLIRENKEQKDRK